MSEPRDAGEPSGRTLSTADLASRGRDDDVEPSRSDAAPTDATDSGTVGAGAATDVPDERSPLLSDDDAAALRDRWQQIQSAFVDEPRRAVAEADTLVAELMQRLADMFAEERSQLETQWDRGDDVSTEELRVALQRYRSFFDRLLAA